MAKVMEAEVIDVGLFGGLDEGVADVRDGFVSAEAAGGEDVALAFLAVGLALAESAFDFIDDGDDAAVAVLGFVKDDLALFEIDVDPFEVGDLAKAHAAEECELDDGVEVGMG